MMPTAFDTYTATLRQIVAGNLDQTYFLAGPERFMIRNFADRCITAFREKCGEDAVIYHRWGFELRDFDELEILAGGGGLFSSSAMILLHSIQDTPIAFKKGLASFLGNLPPETYMVLDYSVKPARLAWLDALKKVCTFLQLYAPYPHEIMQISQRLADRRNLKLTRAAMQRLMEITGNDLGLMDGELEKIALNAPSDTGAVDVDTVDRISGAVDTATIENWLEAVAKRDRGQAMRSLQEIMRRGNVALPQLVSYTFSQLNTIRLLLNEQDARTTTKTRVSKYWKSRLGHATRNFESEDLDRAMQQLADLDLDFRLGKADMLTSFTLWVARVL